MLRCLTGWGPSRVLLWITALLLLRVALVTLLLLLRVSTCATSQGMLKKRRSCSLCRSELPKESWQ